MEKLNLTLTEGYPTHSGISGLSKDQFFKVHRTPKWYDVYLQKKDFSQSEVSYWPNELAKLNSSFPRIARQSVSFGSLASLPLALETLIR